MGACLSCLGLARRESSSDVTIDPPHEAQVGDTSSSLDTQPSDTHPLLNEPYPPHNYGAVGDNIRSSPQVDPEEIRKQRDALERLCATTSE